MIVHLKRPTAYNSGSGITEIHGRERDDKSPHPSYSPGLVPSDFYLLGYVKQRLRRQSLKTAGDLFSASEMSSIDIETWTLNVVDLKWMERLDQCNATNGGHAEDT
jgi:hypothetical protein